jgi:HK97 family phage portal protein
MSFILRMLGATPAPARNPDDDRWWTGAATQSVSGVHVDADTALKISTVWACVTLLAETIASLPLSVYRNRPDDGRERARNHPLYEILHDQPNEQQTSAEFREMMTGHALLRGNAYAQIIPGPRGPVDQLMPIHPDRVTVEKLPNGRFRYPVQQDDGSKRLFNQEDIFHLRGPSKDGIVGMSIVDYAIDSFGMAMSAERYGGRFYRNDSRPGGVLSTPNKLSKGAAGRLKSGWESAHTAGNQHRVAVLEEGLQWQQVGISPEEAQFLETREFQAEDVCRWFRVPPHMVGLTSKATSWGSGIEQMGIGFVTYTLLPWLTRWKQAISRDLILAPQLYFADFVVEGLLRGDIASRYSAYATGRQWGWLSVNEIRGMENMNRVDNGDVYLQPMNMDEAGQPPDNPQSAIHNPHYRLLAEEAAGRVVRKEIAALKKAEQRHGADRQAWATAVLDFYADHVQHVAQTMRMPLNKSMDYCTAGQRELLTQGTAVLDEWQPRRVNDLVGLALEKDLSHE